MFSSQWRSKAAFEQAASRTPSQARLGRCRPPGSRSVQSLPKDSRRASSCLSVAALDGLPSPRVRTNRAAGRAARHQRQDARRAFRLHRGLRPGRLAARNGCRSRRRALHGAHHVQGHVGLPSTRAISEAIEGVGGSFNAATDRESTVYWVRVPRREAAGDGCRRRADRPSVPRTTTSTTNARSSSRRSAPTSTTRPSTARSCSRGRCSGTGRWGARSAATRPASAPCPPHDPRLLADDVPAGQHRHRRGRRHGPRRARRPGVGRLRDGQRSFRRSRRLRRCPPARGSSANGATPGPTDDRRARASGATIPMPGPWRSSTPCSATG